MHSYSAYLNNEEHEEIKKAMEALIAADITKKPSKYEITKCGLRLLVDVARGLNSPEEGRDNPEGEEGTGGEEQGEKNPSEPDSGEGRPSEADRSEGEDEAVAGEPEGDRESGASLPSAKTKG